MSIVKNVKFVGFVLAAVFCMTSGLSFGEANRKSDNPNTQVRESIPGTSTVKETYIYAGPGLAVYNGNVGLAVNVGALTEVYPDLFVGADLGLNFWSFNSAAGTTVSTGATGVQLLPSAIYRFSVNGSRTIFPYIGLSVGPNIYIGKTTIGGVSNSSSRVLFEALFRPGLYTRLSNSLVLNVEGKLGILDSDFIFLPSANLVFSI
jgi:hypothetical protein